VGWADAVGLANEEFESDESATVDYGWNASAGLAPTPA